MKRFIVASFLFLGWLFYVLSDGSDFQPRTAPATDAQTAQDDAGRVDQPLPKPAPVEAVALVATPAIAPSQPNPIDAVVATLTDGGETPPTQAAEPASDQRLSNVVQGLEGFTADSPRLGQRLTLASLEQRATAASGTQPAEVIAELPKPQPIPADIRKITATRVNMREGPGTTFSIVARLNRGQDVEVLDDSVDGWLRLEVLPDRQAGWISAALVGKAGQ